jgi:hypothetical protein
LVTNVKTSGTLTTGTVTYPNSHGTANQVLTTSGSGTLTWTTPASETHSLDEAFGGGIVFYVTTDGKHGLIAETQDQSSSCTWYNAPNIISDPANHSTAGKLFIDWRLPTKYELNLLYARKLAVGGFSNAGYWSSTENNSTDAWYQAFVDDGSIVQTANTKVVTSYIRAIRAF